MINARKEDHHGGGMGDHVESGRAGLSHVIQSSGNPVRIKHAKTTLS